MESIVESNRAGGGRTDSERAVASEKLVVSILDANRPIAPVPHGLAIPLSVSLTSYAARFGTLPLTLRSLVSQTVLPDRIVLWVSEKDLPELPEAVYEIGDPLLEVRVTEDIGPFTKIIPSLSYRPDDAIVTADDDTYYWPTWLEELTLEWSGDPGDIVAHRVHRITLDAEGNPLPYREWLIDDLDSRNPSPLNFATGVGGVLYPPDSFHADVMRADIFLELSGGADDIWLYWMSRLNGSLVRRTASEKQVVAWVDSQDQALWMNNVEEGNDRAIRELVARYGLPS